MKLNGIILSGRVSGRILPPTYTYWYATLGGAGADVGQGVATDSFDNLYIAGQQASQGQGNNDIIVAKYDSLGILQWQRGLGGVNSDIGNSIATDSSGNVYITGNHSGTDIIIAKYNSSGVFQWQRGLSGANIETARGIATDSSGNVYITGDQSSQGQGSNDIIIAKYNSSGDFQWQRGLGGAQADVGWRVATDSSDNVYIAGYQISQGQGSFDIIIAKYNSSGTFQWQRGLGSINREDGYGIATDSSGNVYVTGYYIVAGNYDIVIAKYNSSGTFQWQRALGGAGYEQPDGLATDSLDNIYVIGRQSSQGEGGSDILIAKYNSSGTLQWQRGLGGAYPDIGIGITIDSSDNICITGASQLSSGNNDILIAKLPSDGSLTGTYGSLVYYVSTLTGTTPTLTQTTPTLTQTTPTLTQTTPTLTQTTPTLVSNTVVIG